MKNPIEQEGLILQRSSQFSPLSKLNDRFTIRLLHPASVAPQAASLAQRINARFLGWIESAQLAVMQVAPAQLEQTMQALRADATIAFVSHVYALANDPASLFYLTDQLTLQFAPGTDASRMQAIAVESGLQILKLVSGVAKAFVFQVTPQANANPLKLANRLLRYPEVWLAEPNIVVPLGVADSVQLPVRRRPPPDPTTLAAWQTTRGDRAIVIAVVSSCLDLAHPEFSGNGKIVAPYSANQSQSVMPPLPTQTAPNCALMPICTDSCLDDQAIEQICEWIIDQGADVVYWDAHPLGNLSLSLRQRMAIARAATQGRQGKGCVFVAATNQPESITMIHPDIIWVAPTTAGDRASGILLSASEPGTGATVAGITALVLAVNSRLTAIEVRQLLQATADKVQPEGDTEGYDATGYSPTFGYGKVNPKRAVEAAEQQFAQLPLVAEWLEFHNSAAVEIPDGGLGGVASLIHVEDDRLVVDLEVKISVEHAFVGDLEIWLRSPNGEAVLLQSRELGRLESLSKTYSLETVPWLKRATGLSGAGTWQLCLIDSVPAHVGRLQHWTLRLGV
ncbi:proprotein convertase P-domain-containing protein [Phormidium tenue FACHB-886]|nr:proprotein convertase P-domain-containing protein [Phormidium tenue FACHB-886]